MKKVFTLKACFCCLFVLLFNGLAKAQLSLNITKADPLCYDDSTGRITVTPSGVAGPYTITLIRGYNRIGEPARVVISDGAVTFSNLTSDGYSIMATAQGSSCAAVHEFVTLDFPEFFSRYFEASDSSCAPCDSRLNFVVEPVDSFTYVWSNGATTPELKRICDGPISIMATHKRTGCRIAASTVSTGSEVGNYLISEIYFCQDQEANFELGQYNSGEGICQNIDPDEVTWDFGDGNTTSGSLTVSHNYTSPGIFTVEVNHPSLGQLASREVIVEEPRIFLYSQVNCNEARSYSFQLGNNCVSSSGGDTPLWNFGDPASGDSNTSAEPNPTHIFSSAGNYLVNVSFAGFTDSLRIDAAETPNDLGGFAYYIANCQTPLVRAFTIEMPCDGSPRWNFGDTASGAANVSSSIFPIHDFTGPGSYEVRLSYISPDEEDTIVKVQTVQVGLAPVLIRSSNVVLQPDSSVQIGSQALAGFSYLWNNNSRVTPITVSNPGEYIVTAYPEGDESNCPFQDTILVAYCGQEVSVRPAIFTQTNLQVWPNPTGNADAVSFNAEPNEHFEVFHTSGKRMFAGIATERTTGLQTGFWSKGLYILIVKKQDGQKQTAKFMVD